MAGNEEGGKRVLIISADRRFSRDLTERIEQVGAEAVIAEDWIQGSRAARTEHPDLIVLGVNFPGKDGLTALKSLQDSVETMLIPVIYMSEGKNPIEEKEALELGAVACFGRRFELDDLVREVGKHI